MIGFVKSSTIIAILLFSASVAFAAGDNLRPAGGNNMHPDGKSNALSHVVVNGNETAYNAVSKVKEDKLKEDKLRILRVK